MGVARTIFLLGASFSLFSSVRGQTSSSANAAQSTSTAGSTSSTGSQNNVVTISLPPLITCSEATFTYTVQSNTPSWHKHIGFFVTGQSSWLEIFDLPDDPYSTRPNGTFNWHVDLPVGLDVSAMFYISDDSGTLGGSATTQGGIVLAGTNGTTCYASNSNSAAGTQSILALASSLDPNFSTSAATSTGTATSVPASSGGGGSSLAGPIAGGVVGGLVIIAALAGFLFYLKRRHERQLAMTEDGYSAYGASEKHSVYQGHPGANFSPPPIDPAFFQHQGYDQYGQPLPSIYAPSEGHHLMEQEASTPVRQTAPMGTLPEPMDANEDRGPSTSTSVNGAAPSHEPSPSPITPFTPVAESQSETPAQAAREAPFEGLDDPSSFSPARSTGRA